MYNMEAEKEAETFYNELEKAFEIVRMPRAERQVKVKYPKLIIENYIFVLKGS